MELGKFEKIVVDAAQTTDELTIAAEEVTPEIVKIGASSSDAAPLVDQLASKTERLAEAAEAAKDRIEAWHDKQEILRTGVGNLNEAVTNGMLPTLDDLIAKMEDERLKTEEVTLGIGTWASTFITKGAEVATNFTTAMGLVRDQFSETRAASELETAKINTSWDRFIVKQDETVMAMDEAEARLRRHRQGNGEAQRRFDCRDGPTVRDLGSEIWGHTGPYRGGW